MRINRLELQGIGPFRDKVEIDFDKLGTSRLYLIDGETCAGKSTLIDAIVYALYGSMAGTDSDDARMRSKYASAEISSYVEVDFTTAKGEYRVRRSPGYMRPKKVGEGETKEDPTAVLFKRLPGGQLEIVESRIATVVTLIETSILGLTKPQFVQTVVLPQGEFATFLRANTATRVEVMEKLFGTELYNKIMALLQEDSKVFLVKLKAILKSLTESLIANQNAAELEADQVTTLKSLIDVANFDELISELDKIALEVSPLVEQAAAENQRLNAELDLANTAVLTRAKEATAQSRFDSLNERLTGMQAAKDSASEKLVAQAEVLAKFKLKPEVMQTAKAVRGCKESLAAQRATASTLLDAETKISQWPERFAHLTEEISGNLSAITDMEEAFAIANELLESRIKETENKADLVQSRTEVLHEIETLTQAANKRAELDLANRALEEAATKLKAASDAALTAQAALSEAQKQRIQNMAGELATNLEADAPCPVCGSVEHPAPAVVDGELVTEDEIAELQAAFDLANAKQTDANSKHAAQKQQVESLEKVVAELGDVDEKLVLLQSNLKDVEEKLSDINQIESAIRVQRSAMAELQSEIAAKQKAKAVLEATLSTEQKQIETFQAQIADLKVAHDSIAELVQELESLTEVLGEVEGNFTDFESFDAEFKKAETELAELPKHEHFGDEAAAKAQQDLLQLQSREASLELAKLRERENALLAIVNAARNYQGEYAKESESNADLLLIAQIFSKDEENQQSLNIFVLAKLFENVLVGANRYLEGLLNAQFRLEIDQEVGNKNSVRGLGIKVFDAFASDYRTAKTLSGGETFCVSLSLALGLADYVRQGAGGIEIGTLFVDEGFGTLSDGPLTDVMNMLTSLQKNGRTVGLISHVDEMKTQIAEKIDVTKASKNKPASVTVSWQG